MLQSPLRIKSAMRSAIMMDAKCRQHDYILITRPDLWADSSTASRTFCKAAPREKSGSGFGCYRRAVNIAPHSLLQILFQAQTQLA